MRHRQGRVAIGAAFLLLAASAWAEDPPSTTPPPPPPPQASDWKFAFHGFLGGSLFLQDAFTGPSAGGQALWAAGALHTDKLVLGGDIRQNRLNFSIAGPTVLGAVPRGVAEIDFFGGNGTGGFGDVSVYPRAREFYAELGWENLTIRIGQDYSLVAGFNTLGSNPSTAGAMAFPTSVGHIAFPLTYGAGTLGWRYPGIFGFYRIPFDGSKLELSLMVARSGWANPANPGVGTVVGTTANNPFFTTNDDLGSASGLPQIEARAIYSVGDWLGLVLGGHWNNVDPSGWGVAPTGTCGTTTTTPKGTATGCSDKQVYAGTFNFRLNLKPILFQGGGYIGQNDTPLIGEVLQFPNLGAPDVSEWGGWLQAGYLFTDELGFYFLAGTEHPDWDAAKAAGENILVNSVYSAMLRYAYRGMAFALEYAHWHTLTNSVPAAPAVAEKAIDGNQLMFSTFYFF